MHVCSRAQNTLSSWCLFVVHCLPMSFIHSYSPYTFPICQSDSKWFEVNEVLWCKHKRRLVLFTHSLLCTKYYFLYSFFFMVQDIHYFHNAKYIFECMHSIYSALLDFTVIYFLSRSCVCARFFVSIFAHNFAGTFPLRQFFFASFKFKSTFCSQQSMHEFHFHCRHENCTKKKRGIKLKSNKSVENHWLKHEIKVPKW